MMRMHKNFLLIAAILGFLGVAFGAFGAHGLRNRLSPEMLSVFEIGVRYQMYHVFALLGVAAAIGHFGQAAIAVYRRLVVPCRHSDFLGKSLRARADGHRHVRCDHAHRRSGAPHRLGVPGVLRRVALILLNSPPRRYDAEEFLLERIRGVVASSR